MVRSVYKLFKIPNHGAIRSLPKAYIDSYEKQLAPAERVHDKPPETKYLDYAQDEQSGYVYRIPDHPIPVTMPPNSKYGLWGNTGCVVGFEKPKRLKPRWTKIWEPTLEKHTFFSDILDSYINVTVSIRTLELIDECKGFDFYILSTSVQDLNSELGRKLKYKMITRLSDDDITDYLKQKYKDYVKPKQNVEWDGLKIHEAMAKVKSMRIDESIEPPLRQQYGQELLESLKKQAHDEGRQ